MRNAIGLFVVLGGVWLLWSGHYEPLLLALGAGSVAFVVAISLRMKIVDAEGAPLALHFPRLLGYVVWLAREIIAANLDVARRVLAPGTLDIAPRLVRVPTSQRTDLGRVIYANSITLTPGTISVDVESGEILVHALHAQAANGVLEGVMNEKCAALEGDPQ